jgi:dolichol-phosphate mannosyltransferase
MKDVSIITPIHNEHESLDLLFANIFSTMDSLDVEFEVIAIDDGSDDGSFEVAKSFAQSRKELKVIRLSRNFGQTAALTAGIDYSSGKYIVAIDADLQNDPKDIPRLLEKLDQGYDVVSGWRKDRKDATIRRNLLSRWANRLISRVSGIELHDFGCTLKGYRAELISNIKLYGEMHRFIPVYVGLLGGKVIEIPVSHTPRVHGQSKYGLERVFKVIFDLMVIKFLSSYFTKPMYLFGSFGFLAIAISFASFSWMLYLKFFEDLSMIQTPLPVLSAISFLVGIMSILIGLVAEMLVRTYYESQRLAPYVVIETINDSGRQG